MTDNGAGSYLEQKGFKKKKKRLSTPQNLHNNRTTYKELDSGKIGEENRKTAYYYQRHVELLLKLYHNSLLWINPEIS